MNIRRIASIAAMGTFIITTGYVVKGSAWSFMPPMPTPPATSASPVYSPTAAGTPKHDKYCTDPDVDNKCGDTAACDKSAGGDGSTPYKKGECHFSTAQSVCGCVTTNSITPAASESNVGETPSPSASASESGTPS